MTFLNSTYNFFSGSILLMYEDLPDELDLALRLINSKKEIDLREPYLQKLLAIGYIRKNFFGGWRITSKGRQYLRERAIPQDWKAIN